MDMDEILLRDDEYHGDGDGDETSVAPPPPLTRILDFLESGLLLGMGLLKSGNFLYMFGGEYRDFYESFNRPPLRPEEEMSPSSSVCYYPLVFGAGLCENDTPPRLVYKLDLADPQSEPLKLDSMLGPKIYAIVEEIGGLIYILSRKCLNLSVKRPLFEVWNPETEKSRALPNPPSFSQGRHVWHYHVCGSTIVCGMEFYVYNYFDTASETWNCVEDLPSPELWPMEMRDVRNKDVFLVTSEDDGNVSAFMPRHEENAGPPIKLVFDISKTYPEISGFSVASDSVFLAHTHDQVDYMCGLVSYGSKKAFAYALSVFVFRVEKIESGEGPLLSVNYLSRRVYDFTKINCRNEELPMFVINKAFL